MGDSEHSKVRLIFDKINTLAMEIRQMQIEFDSLDGDSFIPVAELSNRNKRYKDYLGITDTFQELFLELYKKCTTETFFWQYCPFDVYKKTFKERLKQFNSIDFEDSDEVDFWKSEVDLFLNLKLEDDVYIYYYNLENFRYIRLDFFSYSSIKKIAYSYIKKKRFAEEKLINMDTAIEPQKNPELELDKSEYLDYSACPHPERFVMLHELGIIDYLRNKMPVEISERKLAALISTFTGIDKENLRKMINGTKNNDHNNKINKDSVSNYHRKLHELGIDPIFFKKEK